ncbi:hypothetical protein KBY97_06580 [Synechococcus sp. ATX 2A4]|uniref:hypothetical protein n=1 Tax=Synechococcus sp. ATX 2A4 TaxID=2823727 RepID=UPI0020CDD758|nr:hypothetical protein [Synechococcus sp. ATX 2A4]MCP9884792.1 hypothetical protein [Synechococcus sp. ATX 2A4]
MGPLIGGVAAIRGALELVGARPDSLPASAFAGVSLAIAMQAIRKSARIYAQQFVSQVVLVILLASATAGIGYGSRTIP